MRELILAIAAEVDRIANPRAKGQVADEAFDLLLHIVENRGVAILQSEKDRPRR